MYKGVPMNDFSELLLLPPATTTHNFSPSDSDSDTSTAEYTENAGTKAVLLQHGEVWLNIPSSEFTFAHTRTVPSLAQVTSSNVLLSSLVLTVSADVVETVFVSLELVTRGGDKGTCTNEP